MLCDVCKQKEAKIHYTEVVEGKLKKADLCEACAKAKGVDDSTSFALADMLLGLGAAQELEQASGGSELRCPNCGFSQADFKKTGRLGCSECYTTFADGLENLLRTMHKGSKHVGKVPHALRQSQDLSERLKSLEKKLEKAVSEENYELAVNLRDEIKHVKSRLTELLAAND